MNSLETLLALSAWISLAILITQAIPLGKAIQTAKAAKARQNLLYSKTACEVMFLDYDYSPETEYDITANASGNKLHYYNYSEKCAASLIGDRITYEKRWYK